MLLAAPAVLYVAAVMVFPVFYLVRMSFQNYTPMRSEAVTPAGFDNYAWLAGDELTRKSLWITLVFTLVSVTIEMVAGAACAVLLAKVMLAARGRTARLFSRVLGSAFVLPFAVPAVAGAFAWKMVLDTRFGPLNALLGKQVTWLVDYALPSVIVIDAWKMTPFIVFVLLAAVLSIEPTQYEAAELDGAGPWQQFRWITIPCIAPVFAVAAAFRAVDAFTKVFDTVFATTGGGPGTDTQVFPLMIWRTAFTNLDFGKAASQAVLALLISLVFGAALLVTQRRNRV